ncbi:tRNA (guanosine(46)-N7)-methyltransferase TrmB [Buchnera aphidicola]|nr:tRNA (guanosine(46)-N7)-methyltransferase TrmB [Buchnera aphidicola]
MIMRRVRSFVSRNRKLTQNKRQFLKNYLLKYGIDFSCSYVNFNFIFNNEYPVILEIGFGTGEFLINMARKNLFSNFLGIEVYIPSILSCLRYIHKYNLPNVKVIFYDAVEVISYMISNNSLSEVYILFPDPWPKRRHHKRRIITKELLEVILKKLVFGGYLNIATDCQIYAKSILNIIENIKGYINLSNTGDYVIRSDYRLVTKFEKKGLVLGNKIFNLKFKSIFNNSNFL